MKIFHIVATDSEWGGLERSVVELVRTQAATHEVRLAAAPLVLERLDASVDRVSLPMQRSRRDPLLLWQLARAIRAYRPDIIHAHANKAAALVNALRFFLPPAATVATVQNTKRSVRVFKPFDQVIAVSQRAGSCLGDIPHHVIWNAIPRAVQSEPETNALAETDLPFLGGSRPILAAVGRLVPAKGFDILLESLRTVDACLWIIGDGRLRAELETRARTAGVSDRVWFAGFRNDVSRLTRLADLMVISSRNEGFPFALVEMLHLERPVVGTRVAGVEDILPPSCLCPVEDAPALAKTINRALDRRASLAAEFAPVFAFAARELSLEHTAPRIEAVYAQALAGR